MYKDLDLHRCIDRFFKNSQKNDSSYTSFSCAPLLNEVHLN